MSYRNNIVHLHQQIQPQLSQERMLFNRINTNNNITCFFWFIVVVNFFAGLGLFITNGRVSYYDVKIPLSRMQMTNYTRANITIIPPQLKMVAIDIMSPISLQEKCNTVNDINLVYGLKEYCLINKCTDDHNIRGISTRIQAYKWVEQTTVLCTTEKSKIPKVDAGLEMAGLIMISISGFFIVTYVLTTLFYRSMLGECMRRDIACRPRLNDDSSMVRVHVVDV
jgi:hypothetical protein